mgnify:CR=1 FL=1
MTVKTSTDPGSTPSGRANVDAGGVGKVAGSVDALWSRDKAAMVSDGSDEGVEVMSQTEA